jgi:hypothetical protein
MEPILKVKEGGEGGGACSIGRVAVPPKKKKKKKERKRRRLG